MSNKFYGKEPIRISPKRRYQQKKSMSASLLTSPRRASKVWPAETVDAPHCSLKDVSTLKRDVHKLVKQLSQNGLEGALDKLPNKSVDVEVLQKQLVFWKEKCEKLSFELKLREENSLYFAQEFEKELQKKNSKLLQLKEVVREQHLSLAALQEASPVTKKNNKEERLLKQNEELQVKCCEFEQIINQLADENRILKDKILSLTNQLAEKDHHLSAKQHEMASMETKMAKQSDEIKDLQSKSQIGLEYVNSAIQLRETNHELEATISYYSQMLELRDKEIQKLEQSERCEVLSLSEEVEEQQKQVLQLMDLRQNLLRAFISDRDGRIAELKESKMFKKGKKDIVEEVTKIRVESTRLQEDLQRLNKERAAVKQLHRQESNTQLYRQCRGGPRAQIEEELFRLNSIADRLSQFIDKVLAVVLKSNCHCLILEDMPTLQRNTGIRPQLLSMATKAELLHELKEKESGCLNLKHYITLLLERIIEHDSTIFLHLNGDTQ